LLNGPERIEEAREAPGAARLEPELALAAEVANEALSRGKQALGAVEAPQLIAQAVRKADDMVGVDHIALRPHVDLMQCAIGVKEDRAGSREAQQEEAGAAEEALYPPELRVDREPLADVREVVATGQEERLSDVERVLASRGERRPGSRAGAKTSESGVPGAASPRGAAGGRRRPQAERRLTSSLHRPAQKLQ